MNTNSATGTYRQLNEDTFAYDTEGYCVFRSVLEPQEIERARRELDTLISEMPATVNVFRNGRETQQASRPEYLTEPHSKPHGQFWLDLCRNRAILDAVESVIGPDLLLVMSHLIVKRPSDGLPVAWHQDATYWPSIEGTDLATVWLAIDDADSGNGCMNVIPRTQQGRNRLEQRSTGESDLLGTRVDVTPEIADSAVPICLAAGDMSIHDAFIIHGSAENTSPRRRAGFTIRFANSKTTKVDPAKHWVPVYRVRGERGPGEDFIDIR